MKVLLPSSKEWESWIIWQSLYLSLPYILPHTVHTTCSVSMCYKYLYTSGGNGLISVICNQYAFVSKLFCPFPLSFVSCLHTSVVIWVLWLTANPAHSLLKGFSLLLSASFSNPNPLLACLPFPQVLLSHSLVPVLMSNLLQLLLPSVVISLPCS